MFKIYGHFQCTWCGSAKEELTKRGVEFEYLDVREDEKAFEDYSQYNFRTVPLILDGDYVVGGFDKLVNYLESRELEDLDFSL